MTNFKSYKIYTACLQILTKIHRIQQPRSWDGVENTEWSIQTIRHLLRVIQSISLFASKYTYLNIIYVNGRSPEKHRVQLAGDL